MEALPNLPIASPRTFRFAGGYLRLGMPIAYWLHWFRFEARFNDVRVYGFCAGPLLAWARVDVATLTAASPSV